MDLKALNKWQNELNFSEKMPVLFLGHGSPMNAIEENDFVKNWRTLSLDIPKPAAILVVSAHWETRGTAVTSVQKPATIHDFRGFPQALFDVQYPAPGDPELAQYIQTLLKHYSPLELSQVWGLDHGTWSVVKHLYPAADVPVLQFSLDVNKTPAEHYALAAKLAGLRQKGVLIIGSGNLIHNLRMVAWDKLQSPGYGYDWAIETNEKLKSSILNGDHHALINFDKIPHAAMAIPTAEHYLPLLYVLGLQQKNDELSFMNDDYVGGSLSMTSVVLR